MNDELHRLRELYSSGGTSAVIKGLFRYIWTSPTVKRGRAIPTKILGGESVWGREWDVLCVLDGCRTDLFREIYGESDQISSVGSTSRTWINRTFSSCESPEHVGYITGNPFYFDINTDSLGYFHVQSTEQTEQEIETAHPLKLSEHAISVWRRREELSIDKLVIHFMQPHAPFRSKPEWFTRAVGEDSWSADIWKRLEQGEFTKEEVWNAYADNLKWVLRDGIKPLQKNCDGTIAMTADHGNAMGEWGFYGHPRGCPISEVRKVPWQTVEGEDKNTTQPETEISVDSVNIENQLRALGYK